jgi:citrate synthase
MVARTVGWLAHALEQRVSGEAVSFRTRYAADGDANTDAANAA